MVVVQRLPNSVKQYAKAIPFPGRHSAIPDRCPHPEYQAAGSLIRWGTYGRWACTANDDYRSRIQRLRCKVCGRTRLLPSFLHPHRHHAISLLQLGVPLHLVVGPGLGRLTRRLLDDDPARSTVRERIASFAYGAGEPLLDFLLRQFMTLVPLAELPDTAPPQHLNRIPDLIKRHRLERARCFRLLAKQPMSNRLNPEDRRTEIALFRYTLILPLLRGPYPRRGKGQPRRQIAARHYDVPCSSRHTVSVPTLARWEGRCREHGFNGLKPQLRQDRD